MDVSLSAVGNFSSPPPTGHCDIDKNGSSPPPRFATAAAQNARGGRTGGAAAVSERPGARLEDGHRSVAELSRGSNRLCVVVLLIRHKGGGADGCYQYLIVCHRGSSAAGSDRNTSQIVNGFSKLTGMAGKT
eukprot:768715-Hanusia_phi.AAC.7